MNLYELGRWKQQIAIELAKDKNIQEILLPDPDPKYDIEDQLLGNLKLGLPGHIFKHEYIPGTQEEAKSFIYMETVIPKVKNTSTFSVYLYVYPFCHKSLIDNYSRTGSFGTRADILSSDVDKILNGNNDLGIGPMELISVERYTPAQNYYGRVLVYSNPTFNR